MQISQIMVTKPYGLGADSFIFEIITGFAFLRESRLPKRSANPLSRLRHTSVAPLALVMYLMVSLRSPCIQLNLSFGTFISSVTSLPTFCPNPFKNCAPMSGSGPIASSPSRLISLKRDSQELRVKPTGFCGRSVFNGLYRSKLCLG